MPAYLGLDIAKATIAVALLGPAKPRKTTIPTTAAGAVQLLAWLDRQHLAGPFLVGMEATGPYWEDVAPALHDAGLHVRVINPARIAAYATSILQRTKTDAADAVLIARFMRAEQPAAWTPPAPAYRELRTLVRHYDALLAQRQAEANRLQTVPALPAVHDAIRAHLVFLDQQLDAVQQQIHDHLDQHPDLKQQHDLLTTIPGIGSRTATRLLAEAGDLRRFATARALVAYVGLTPRHRQSGTRVRGRSRLCNLGHATLRAALYMPAVVAKHHNPVVAALCRRLAERGLVPKAQVGAAMRRLVHLAYGVLKSQQPFDPTIGLASRPGR